MPQGMQIGTLAQQTGLTVDAIRFYERSGLLKRASRSASGFRMFSPKHIQDLKFIRRAQDLGFSLQEVRELLFLQDGEVPACSHVREFLNQKVADVRAKIDALRRLEKSLAGAMRNCDQELSKSGAHHEEHCPVLDDFAHAIARREH